MKSNFMFFLFLIALFNFNFIPNVKAQTSLPKSITGQETVFVKTLMFSRTTGKVTEGGRGTGSIVRSDERGSIILTNAHVCLISPSEMAYRQFDPSIFFVKKIKLHSGEEYKVSIKKVSKDHDMCLLETSELRGVKSLKFSNNPDLPRKEMIYVTGYPGGLYTGLPPIVTGFPVSYLKMNGRFNLIISVPIVPGQSGSPVLNNKNQIIGLVWGYSPRSPQLGIVVPLTYLQDFISDINFD